MIYEDRCTPIPCPDCQPEQPKPSQDIVAEVRARCKQVKGNWYNFSPPPRRLNPEKVLKALDQQAAEIKQARSGCFGFIIQKDEKLIEGMRRNYAEFDNERTRLNKQIERLSEQANEIGGINLQLNKQLKTKEEIIDELEADRRDLQLIIITKNGELKAKDEEISKLEKAINDIAAQEAADGRRLIRILKEQGFKVDYRGGPTIFD
jgi:DNA repair exonuclease SbcCD ATPase subunit